MNLFQILSVSRAEHRHDDQTGPKESLWTIIATILMRQCSTDLSWTRGLRLHVVLYVLPPVFSRHKTMAAAIHCYPVAIN